MYDYDETPSLSNCNSRSFTKISNNRYRCNRCGGEWLGSDAQGYSDNIPDITCDFSICNKCGQRYFCQIYEQ